MNSQIDLRCLTSTSVYSVCKPGEAKATFSSFGQAFKYASSLVAEATPLTIYNEVGNPVAETWIQPVHSPAPRTVPE
jgi:hypothetical protein